MKTETSPLESIEANFSEADRRLKVVLLIKHARALHDALNAILADPNLSRNDYPTETMKILRNAVYLTVGK